MSFCNDRGSTHLAVDVLGWFPTTVAPPSTTRVSVLTGEGQANGGSDYPDTSADGRYVTVSIFASSLVSGDTHGAYDVFACDQGTH